MGKRELTPAERAALATAKGAKPPVKGTVTKLTPFAAAQLRRNNRTRGVS